MQQEEYPIKDAETYDLASENIKNWFEANKEVLISRNQQGSESLSGTEKNQILETNSNYRSAQKGNPC